MFIRAQLTGLERKIVSDAELAVAELYEAVVDARSSRRISLESIRDTYMRSTALTDLRKEKGTDITDYAVFKLNSIEEECRFLI